MNLNIVESGNGLADGQKTYRCFITHVRPHYTPGLANQDEGKTKEAIESFQKFVMLAPRHYAPYLWAVNERIRELEEKIYSKPSFLACR